MKRRTVLWWGIGALALMVNVGVIFGFRWFARWTVSRAGYRMFRISTSNMTPTLQVGEQVMAQQGKYIAAGNIVVHRSERGWRVTRVIATENRVVEIRDKRLFIDGVEMAETYAVHDGYKPLAVSRDNLAPYRVPLNHFFAMGDNRDHSFDSRYTGAVSMDDLFGPVVWVSSPNRGTWSPERLPPTPK